MATATPSRTAGASPTQTLTAGSPAPTPGPLVLLRVWAVPNPNPTNFRVKLEGACDQLTVSVYSVAMDKVAGSERSGLLASAYVDVPAPRGLAAGIYYGRVQGRRGAAYSNPVLVKFCVLR